MGTTWMAGVLMATAFIWSGHPSVAQDKGKTEEAELGKRVAGGLAEAVRAARSSRNSSGQRRRPFWCSRKSRKPASGLAVSMAKARC